MRPAKLFITILGMLLGFVFVSDAFPVCAVESLAAEVAEHSIYQSKAPSIVVVSNSRHDEGDDRSQTPCHSCPCHISHSFSISPAKVFVAHCLQSGNALWVASDVVHNSASLDNLKRPPRLV